MKRDLFTPAKQARSERPIPFDFVLAGLTELTPFVRPMFGAHAVYVDERIVFILREKSDLPQDNGVWIATTPEHHDSLEQEFPSLRPISIFGEKSQWRMLPADSVDFEEAAIRACLLVLRGDPRIGKLPGAEKRKRASAPRRAAGSTKPKTKPKAKSKKTAPKPKRKAKVSNRK